MNPRFDKSPFSTRLFIGCVIAGFIWTLYLVRLIWAVGPMHDQQGNPAPAYHYLIGALVVTAMVVAWIAVRARWQRK